jgi:hypothetical protein
LNFFCSVDRGDRNLQCNRELFLKFIIFREKKKHFVFFVIFIFFNSLKLFFKTLHHP